MVSIEDIASDFEQVPNASVSYGGRFITVNLTGSTSDIVPVYEVYEDVLEYASDHPAYDMSGHVLSIVYEYTG